MLTHKVRLQNISDTLNTWRVCLFYFKSFGLLSSSSFMIWMFKLLVKRVLVYGYFGEKFWKHFALFSYNFWERGFIFVVICATYIDDGQPTCVVIRKMFCGIAITENLPNFHPQFFFGFWLTLSYWKEIQTPEYCMNSEIYASTPYVIC